MKLIRIATGNIILLLFVEEIDWLNSLFLTSKIQTMMLMLVELQQN